MLQLCSRPAFTVGSICTRPRGESSCHLDALQSRDTTQTNYLDLGLSPSSRRSFPHYGLHQCLDRFRVESL